MEQDRVGRFTPHMERSKRKRQVEALVALAHLKGSKSTCASIARRIGLRPSTHLRKLMNEIVRDGRLTSVEIQYRGNIKAVLYKPNECTRSNPRWW